ncbi:hypothetical protein [Terriglobus tenax]|uniref:hypothetical protein n=1 Tax=Terriglobus tenax TaxID=1111115 RepID=UPI0021DF467B|nr:hypothetical protein [Terriglobus tenax]
MILVVSEVVASDIFYVINPLGPVCSRFATKWDYINEHFVVAMGLWALIGLVSMFLTNPMFWQSLRRSDEMQKGFFYCGLIGLVVDGGASAYQRWVATIDMSVHTWTRLGLILNASLRTVLWLVLYTALSVAFIAWAKVHEADFIE